MTDRQRAFARAYIETGSAAEAARRAGYNEKSARQIGGQLLTNVDVRAYIAAALERKEATQIASADEVLEFWTKVLRGQVRDQFNLEASLSDRLKAASELMKRYAVADMREQSTMQKLDGLLLEFRLAVGAGDDNQDAPTEAGKDEQ